jgi:hypothetical protein
MNHALKSSFQGVEDEAMFWPQLLLRRTSRRRDGDRRQTYPSDY